MNPINDSAILSKQGMIRLWLVEMGWMNQLSTAIRFAKLQRIALQHLELENRRNCATLAVSAKQRSGDGSQGTAENSPKDVISSDGLNLTNIWSDESAGLN